VPADVFLSYCRSSSAAHARALHDVLGSESTFLDTEDIPAGEHFPSRLSDGILSSRIVVVFADAAYFRSWYCRKELGLALSPGESAVEHVVLALAPGTDLSGLPASLALTNWPAPNETERVASLIQSRLAASPLAIRDRLPAATLAQLRRALEEASIPQPYPFGDIVTSGPIRPSLGDRFVGRGDDLARLHLLLGIEGAGAAPVTCRVTGMPGIGKTRFALEYLHRYGTRWFKGGIFWIDTGAREGLMPQFRAALHALDPADPALNASDDAAVVAAFSDRIRRRPDPVLCIVDGIPETRMGEPAHGISPWCPPAQHLWVIATSGEEIYEAHTKTLSLSPLPPAASALLLSHQVPGGAEIAESEWERLAAGQVTALLEGWNRALRRGSIAVGELSERIQAGDLVEQLYRARQRGPTELGDSFDNVVRSVARAFESLDDAAGWVAALLAQLGPDPLPEDLLKALPPQAAWANSRASLRSRHFLIGAAAGSLGSMHPVIGAIVRMYTSPTRTTYWLTPPGCCSTTSRKTASATPGAGPLSICASRTPHAWSAHAASGWNRRHRSRRRARGWQASWRRCT